ncbi:alpha-hydroxy-acid oxidizing protein [Rhodanobacter sp. DHG33]|uniref:alpha-hydroxy-acid oxidizing protein n=1 Tax=Rhodanobacter sp. DHG33 TaxID=2775921 RepID=UPI0017828A98|nr:alpha-hydroxy-acid oxidizing protein [Rhodanobacter sp. DHG33]MBD8897913.1 alpha-hydroxy-acid oxidizing protein [Rhodanobacter sp. DHG33]
MKPLINVDDYREAARRRIPQFVFDYLEGGAEEERGLRHNREALARIRFKPRRLRDVARRDSSRGLFGKRLPVPFVVAPTGLNGLLWPRGDLVLAKAAARNGIPFILSTASSSSIEEVARASDGDHWFQLYIIHRHLAEQLVRRARAADYTTLVLTVDVVKNGIRERDLRNRFGLPLRITPAMLWDGLTHPRWGTALLRHGAPKLANFLHIEPENAEVQAALLNRSMDATFDWSGLTWLRDLWPHRLIVKGILTAEDAMACIRLGADGVVLSNHGGRQLDDCIAPIEALSDVRNSVPTPILIDSGFRRGSDIVKALALGADAVMLGRALLYGLAARGEAGIDGVIALLRWQLDTTLAQIGCASLDEVCMDHIMVGVPA